MKSRLFMFTYLLTIGITVHAQELLTENFDNSSFSTRGWYDIGSIVTSSTDKVGATGSSLEMKFPAGATTPIGRGMRHLITGSDSVYLRYAIKFSNSWTGSNKNYHPHMFYFLTNKDDKWIGPAETHLTLYVEQNEGKMLLAIQDTKNVDQANIGNDLTNTTENRGVAGCNGQSDVYNDNCYKSGTLYRNEKKWKSSTENFNNQPGSTDQTKWHIVEAFVKLNSISSGIAVADGILTVQVDGNTVISHDDVMFRTAVNSDMKINQFFIGPYIGDGAPVDQAFWIDDLFISDNLPLLAKPKPPTNLQVIN